ncbi:hypothetical protein IFO70_35570 [Phormidium tenue FACHB-886]|nr:hypothetical protein [Phormidium tenue FACHB-886]
MIKSMFKPHWILLTLAITLSSSFTFSLTSSSSPISSSSEHSTVSLSESPNLKQLRTPPERPAGARGDGDVCAISPGILEQQNVVWSDQPLFLWNASSKLSLQRLDVIDQTGKIVWEKPLAATAQSALYEGQPLQPGQYYTWRLQWTQQNDEAAANAVNERTITFQLMEPEQQRQIATELQTLTQQLHGASAETIANQQADYLTNRSEPLWSDAMRILYTVENPSRQTTQKLQSWISAACVQEGN